jgi:predicted O-linked N-acetylglucosamine transferase (SPINDLY family)
MRHAYQPLDVLWMGVPVVGLRGDRGIARGTYSILRTLEADDLIAKSPEEFVEINLRLAQDGAWRARLRDTLRQRLEISPLMDSRTFTSALEQRYRAMWGEWCAARRDAST